MKKNRIFSRVLSGVLAGALALSVSRLRQQQYRLVRRLR